MESTDLQEWAQGLIDKLKDNFPKAPAFAIFYSPVYLNPYLMVIGDNPGGSENNRQANLPIEHEYFQDTYKLAGIMRKKIFEGEQLNSLLKNSITLNRIFFKSTDLKGFEKQANATDLKKYCFKIVEEIIDKIKPKMIFAVSFGTFRMLSPHQENVILKKNENKKSLLLEGIYNNNIKVIGINHPSRASFHKINDNDWKNVNLKLKEIFN